MEVLKEDRDLHSKIVILIDKIVYPLLTPLFHLHSKIVILIAFLSFV